MTPESKCERIRDGVTERYVEMKICRQEDKGTVANDRFPTFAPPDSLTSRADGAVTKRCEQHPSYARIHRHQAPCSAITPDEGGWQRRKVQKTTSKKAHRIQAIDGAKHHRGKESGEKLAAEQSTEATESLNDRTVSSGWADISRINSFPRSCFLLLTEMWF